MNLVESSEAGLCPFEKEMKKKNKNKRVQHAGPSQVIKKSKIDKSQAKCFHYEK